MSKLIFVFVLMAFISNGIASSDDRMAAVLTDTKLLTELGIEPLVSDESSGVSYANLSSVEREELSRLAHKTKKCGGFEVLSFENSISKEELVQIFQKFHLQNINNLEFEINRSSRGLITKKAEIESALLSIDSANLKNTVNWLSSYPQRYHKSKTPNVHVLEMKKRVELLIQNSGRAAKIDLINHKNTAQHSLRVRIEGARRASEVLILGGHLDSINQFSFFDPTAPGADDNASGSANVLEVLRVILNQQQLDRSIEFFWYAGEEGGLLGSSEIAQEYANSKTDVIAVIQLDMTLFPGSGAFTLGSMTDFTSAWLRQWLVDINQLYIGASVVEDKCGYGCSDHASWHRNGYAALMPFESGMKSMNKNIHTTSDIVDSASHFEHSAMFSKLALALLMELGNSNDRSP